MSLKTQCSTAFNFKLESLPFIVKNITITHFIQPLVFKQNYRSKSYDY